MADEMIFWTACFGVLEVGGAMIGMLFLLFLLIELTR